MKKERAKARAQIFVLTAEEKKVVAFVLFAFVLGLGTMRYRQTHPRPPPPLTPEQQRAEKAAKARARSARDEREPAGGARAGRPPTSPSPEENDDR